MARATGIEITETEVRIAEIDGSERKFRVLGAASFPIEPDGDGVRGQDQIAAAAKAAMKSIRARRDQIVLGLPAREATIREIVIPFTDPEQIRKVIKFESEGHLPSSNIDDVIVGFYKISEQGPRSRLLIFAVRKDAIRQHIDILGQVGIEPTQVDLSPAALYSLATILPEFEGKDADDTTVQTILDMGAVSTTIIVMEGPRLRMVRSMRLGSDSLTRTLSVDLGVDHEAATTMTQTLLTSEQPFASAGELRAADPSRALTATQLQQDIIRDKESEFARRVATEVRRTLSSVHAQDRLENIWLTGPSSTSPGMERVLKDAFRVPIKHLDVLGRADHRVDSDTALRIGPAIGLALKAAEHDPVRLEFRQEEFAFARKFDRVRNPLIFGTALVLVLFAFLCILEFNQVKDIGRDVQFLAERGQSEFSSLVVGAAQRYATYLKYSSGQEAEDVLMAIRRLDFEQQLRAMIRELGDSRDAMSEEYGIVWDEGGDLPPEQVAPRALDRIGAWAGVMEALRKEKGVEYMVDDLNATDNSITWTWRVPVEHSLVAADFLQERFEALPEKPEFQSGTQKPKGEYSELSGARLEWKVKY